MKKHMYEPFNIEKESEPSLFEMAVEAIGVVIILGSLYLLWAAAAIWN